MKIQVWGYHFFFPTNGYFGPTITQGFRLTPFHKPAWWKAQDCSGIADTIIYKLLLETRAPRFAQGQERGKTRRWKIVWLRKHGGPLRVIRRAKLRGFESRVAQRVQIRIPMDWLRIYVLNCQDERVPSSGWISMGMAFEGKYLPGAIGNKVPIAPTAVYFRDILD